MAAVNGQLPWRGTTAIATTSGPGRGEDRADLAKRTSKNDTAANPAQEAGLAKASRDRSNRDF
jgi:hypothetical protein